MSERLAEFVDANPRLFVMTGAGISTASGIGDYRSDVGEWKRKPPVELREFLRFEHARRRYWSRSMIGWPPFAAAEPNAAHRALACLDAAQRIHVTVTQNVDGLHARAGQRRVVELHGSLARVGCLDCDRDYARADVQRRLVDANPTYTARTGALLADGDAELDEDELGEFRVPACPACGGVLKPRVVFFGESVPRATVERAMDGLADASAVLVIGSSLMVYSGFRFCRTAHAQNKPIVAINRGRTRADAMLTFKVTEDCNVALVRLLKDLRLCFDT